MNKEQHTHASDEKRNSTQQWTTNLKTLHLQQRYDMA